MQASWPAQPLLNAPHQSLLLPKEQPCSEQAFSASLHREISGVRGFFAAVGVCWKPPTCGSVFQLDACFPQTPSEFQKALTALPILRGFAMVGLESFPWAWRDTGYTSMGSFPPTLSWPFLPSTCWKLWLGPLLGRLPVGWAELTFAFAPSKSVGTWPSTPEMLHRLDFYTKVQTCPCLCSPSVEATTPRRQ